MALCGDVAGGRGHLGEQDQDIVRRLERRQPPQLIFAVLGNCLV